MRLALCLILLASVCSAQVSRRVQGDGLVAWYPLNGNAVSITPTNNGAVGVTTVFAASKIDKGVFNATANATRAIQVSPIDFGTTHTVAAWVYAYRQSGAYNYGCVVGDAGAANVGPISFNVSGAADALIYTISTGGASVVLPSNATSNWVHVATVRVGTGVTFYLNGRRIGTGTLPANSAFSFRTLGCRQVSDLFVYTGYYDDIRIYNRALSPQEIAALANSRRRNHSQ
jgi:hypothetical protein